MENLLSQMSKKYPEFLENLKVFSDQIKQELEARLEKEKNSVNFTSTLAEIDFGLLFNKLGFDLDYQKRYMGKELDWIISIGSSKAICEVYRLGKSKNDQFKSDFLSKLASKARELKFKCWVNLNAIKILDSDFDVSEENVVSIIQKLEYWLSSSKDVGEKLTIEDSFEFIIKRIDINSNHLICTVYRPIEFKPEKLIQFEYLKDNNITLKLKKYNEIIRECNYPYFIAIALDFTSGFEFEDFEEYFLGKEVGLDNDDCDDDLLQEGDTWYGARWTERGIFRLHPQLSGLILLCDKKARLLLNPIRRQVIYSEKNRVLLQALEKVEYLT